MGIMKNNSIALFTDMRMPHSHSFLNGVLWEELATDNEMIEFGLVSEGFVPFLKAYDSKRYFFGIGKSGVLGRIVNYFLFILNVPLILSVLKRNNVNLLYVRNDPIFSFFSLCYRFFSRRKAVLFIFQLSHLKEEQLLTTKSSSADFTFFKSLGARVNRLLRDYIIKRADASLLISKTMKEYLVKTIGTEITEKSHVFGLGMSTRWDVQPKELGYNYSVYVGTLDACRDMLTTVSAYITAFKNGGINIPLLIIGGDKNAKDKKVLVDYVKSKRAEQIIHFIPTCDRLECYEYIKGAKFAICTFPDSMINKTISPTKLFEYLYFEVPTLCSYGNLVVENVINESKCGILCEFNNDTIANALPKIELLSNDSTLRNLGKLYISKNHSYSSMANDIREIIYKARSK